VDYSKSPATNQGTFTFPFLHDSKGKPHLNPTPCNDAQEIPPSPWGSAPNPALAGRHPVGGNHPHLLPSGCFPGAVKVAARPSRWAPPYVGIPSWTACAALLTEPATHPIARHKKTRTRRATTPTRGSTYQVESTPAERSIFDSENPNPGNAG